MADLLETLMLICFGCSWPLNIYKAWTARTARGSSLQFYALIWVGYVLGLTGKVLRIQASAEVPLYMMVIYICNVVMTGAGLLIYFRNRALDKKAGEL